MTTPRARARRPITWLMPGLALLGLPCLGLVAGFALSQPAAGGALSRWHRLAPPPSPAEKILAGGIGLSNGSWFLYIRGQDGQTYYCPPYFSGNCWQPSALPASLPAPAPCESPPHFLVPPPPGRTLDTLEAQACNAEAAYQANFAVLQDGSVWRWQHFTSGPAAIATWLLLSIGGLLLGLLVGVIVALRIRSSNKARVD